MERKTRNKPGQVGLMDQMYLQMNENAVPRVHGVKRAGDVNIQAKDAKKTRKAFGDITNRSKSQTVGGKKALKASKVPTKTKKSEKKTAVVVIPRTATGSLSNSQQDRSDTSWDVIELSQPSSQDLSSQFSNSSQSSQDSVTSDSSDKPLEQSVDELRISDKPAHEDVDKDETDLFLCPNYVHSIFEYHKERERKMQIRDYMDGQTDLTTSMRAILVDWLVEVQENFELNHETLYLAVKLVDKYLCDNQMTRERLQLVGSTAMFIACKFDERMPPVLDDFIYICDDAYSRDQLLDMEREILKSVGFDLGYPLSYSFLRRFAKCGHAPIQTLTLARYILEMSLMDYSFVTQYDSMMASAALFLAIAMRDPQHNVDWNATLQYYTSYSKEELLPLVVRLNDMISAPPSRQLQTIRTKYSHTVFHEVATTAPLTCPALASLES